MGRHESCANSCIDYPRNNLEPPWKTFLATARGLMTSISRHLEFRLRRQPSSHAAIRPLCKLRKPLGRLTRRGVCIAVLTVVVWACSGPIFHYSDGWQLVIDTGTTIITFLIVF
jgi:hypothetical protein